MSNISNKFYISAIDDGQTLHGNLSVAGSLSQGWNGRAAVPDWTVAANQPIVYLTLLMGSTPVVPVANSIKWYYNGVLIGFDENTGISTDGLFQRTSYSSSGLSMPALRVISNLANSANVDVDAIKIEGQYMLDEVPLDFAAFQEVRITQLTEGASLGVITFLDGISNITEKGQTITMYGRLYNADGTEASGVTTKWTLNDGTPVDGVTKDGRANTFEVEEGDVTDHATVKCDFYLGSVKVFTAHANIDDLQDAEYMYIQYNSSNGNAASLRRGQSVEFSIWIGTQDNPAVLKVDGTPVYQYFKILLLDSDGNVVTASGLGPTEHKLPDPDGSGYRKLTSTGGVAKVFFDFDMVNSSTVGKKSITAIVYASTTDS